MIRLFVADDHPIVREGLKNLVAQHADLDVVGEAADGNQTLRDVGPSGAEVLLLDVSMPGPGVLEIISRFRAKASTLAILVLSVHDEEQYARRVLRAGASGYLMKDRSPEELVEAIRTIHRGGRYVSRRLAEKLVFDLGSEAREKPHELLSNREYQVMVDLASGLSAKEIAARLALSPKTVATYRARVLEKLQLTTTADLIRYAVERKLLPE